jgi:hypothetical protein
MKRTAPCSLDGAMADNNEAIKLNPKYGAACRDKGNAERKKGDPNGASGDFNRGSRSVEAVGD